MNKFVVQQLEQGWPVTIKPRGQSMTPRIRHGQQVLVKPLESDPIPGDVVLCTVKGRIILHLVTAVKRVASKAGTEYRYQISNNKGRVNGWIPRPKIHGIALV